MSQLTELIIGEPGTSVKWFVKFLNSTRVFFLGLSKYSPMNFSWTGFQKISFSVSNDNFAVPNKNINVAKGCFTFDGF